MSEVIFTNLGKKDVKLSSQEKKRAQKVKEQTLCRQILNLVDEGLHDPGIFKAIFLAGGPGSGKSFVANASTRGLGLKLVNSDVPFAHLLQKAGASKKLHNLSHADRKKTILLRDRAKALTRAQKSNFIIGRLGMVVDGTGKDYNKIAKQRNELAELGYDTYMIFVNVPLEAALKRNRERERTVGDDIVTAGWNQVQKNLGKFQSLFTSSNFSIIDTGENLASDDKTLAKLWRAVRKFVKTPINNAIAKQWVEDEKVLRRRK